jgi:hypothetical protein
MDQQQPKVRLTRRNVMIAGGTAAVAGLGVVALTPLGNPVKAKAREALAASSWGQSMLSLADGTMAEWQAQVGATFAVGGGTSMRLAGVRPLNSDGERPLSVTRRAAFVAHFDVLGGQSLPGELIYTASHPQYGPLQIFLSESGETPRRMLAVFN